MAQRYFNWKLAVVLLMGLAVLGGTAWGLRQWQRGRRAEMGLELGSKAYSEGRWEDAARQLGRYIGVVQDDVPALLKYAAAQMNTRPVSRSSVQQAIGAYRNILRLDPNNLEAATKLGEMYLSMDMPGEAELIVSRVLDRTDSPELRRILAVAMAGQRRFGEAAEVLKALIEKDPRQVAAYELLGRLIEQRPRDFNENASVWFERATQANPASAQAYVSRAAFRLRQGDRAAALEDLAQAEGKAQDSAVRLLLAEQWAAAGEIERADKQFAAVQQLDPNNQLLWQRWAQTALRTDSNEMMLRIADGGLVHLSSQPWDFMPLAAELYIRAGQLERARDCLTRMKQKDVSPAGAAFLEGLLAESRGHGYEALRLWRDALRLGARPARVRPAVARLLSRLGDKQSAVLQLRTMVSEQPNLTEAREMLARLMIETGQFSAAAEQLRVAVQLSPHSAELQLLALQVRLRLLAESGVDKASMAYRELEEDLNALGAQAADSIDFRLLRLQLAADRGDMPGANAQLQELKAVHSADARVSLAEAMLLAMQGGIDRAIAGLRQASAQSPDSVSLVKHLAALLWDSGERAECERVILEAFQKTGDPLSKRDLGLLLAAIYAGTNQQQKRCELLEQLAWEMDADVLIQRELLECTQSGGDFAKSQQIVDKIRQIEGEDGWQWRYGQARLWFAQSDFPVRYTQIVSLLQENLLTNPDDQESRMLLAEAHRRGGNQRLAVSVYEEVLSRSPRDAGVISRVVAELYRANEFQRADEILRQANQDGVEDSRLRRFELESHIRRGELSSASDVLQNLLEQDPNNDSVGLSLALLKMRQDRFGEAQKLLDDIAEREPNMLALKVATIEMNVRQGRTQEAMTLCNAIVSRYNSAFAYILRGRVRAMLSDISGAGDDFRLAVQAEPNNAEAWLAKSDFERSVGVHADAVASVERAVSLAPDDTRIQQRAISLYLASNDLNRHKQGRELLRQAMQSNPSDIALRLQQARLLLSEWTAPSIQEATMILEMITESRPRLQEPWVLLAEAALRQDEPMRAIDVTMRGLIYRPDDKTLMLLRARAEQARSPLLAVPTLMALRLMDPNDAEVVTLLADVFTSAEQYDRAVDVLKSHLSLPQDEARKRKLEMSLASVLFSSGAESEASELFSRLSASAPDDSVVLLTEVRTLANAKRWDQVSVKVRNWQAAHPADGQAMMYVADELSSIAGPQAAALAEQAYRFALQASPDAPAAAMKLAGLMQAAGRGAEAVELYRRVLQLDENNIVAMNNLAWLLCEERGQHKEALELARQAIDKGVDYYVDLYDTRGVAYYRLGQFDKAVEDMKRCVRLYPPGTPALAASHFHLARALAQLGEKAQAAEQVNKAIELNERSRAMSDKEIAEAEQLLAMLSKGGT